MIFTMIFNTNTIAKIIILIAQANSKLGCSLDINYHIINDKLVALPLIVGLSLINVPIV